jgi:serine/threonine-protein kinase
MDVALVRSLVPGLSSAGMRELPARAVRVPKHPLGSAGRHGDDGRSMVPDVLELPAPFGKYTLLKALGHGGTAEVFLARTAGSRTSVVIKRLLPEWTSEVRVVEMLVGEAKVAALLNHPAIVRIHELGREAGQIYLAMEYVPGWDMRALAKAAGRIPPAIAARTALAVAEALAHAHKCTDLEGHPLHLVHRDVTPSNIMVTPTGQVKLIDFGVAKASTQLSLTQPGIVKGKFRFMSPEQIQNKALDGRSDLFSLGVSLYEMTTGRKPFEGSQIMEVFTAILKKSPPPPSQVLPNYPAALEAIILHALEKNRDQRYPDAETMARDLREALPKLRGPSDIGAFARGLAAERPEILPPPERSEPESPPVSVEPPVRELTIINLSLPERDRVPEPEMGLPSLPLDERSEPVAVLPSPSATSADPAWTDAPSMAPQPMRSSRRRRERSRVPLFLGLALLAAATAVGTCLLLLKLVAH